MKPNSSTFWNATKGLYAGQRGFVIGNGPSLRITDLQAMRNEISIASNKIFLSYPHTDWRPTLYTLADVLVIEKTKHVVADTCGLCIAPSSSAPRWPANADIRYFKDLGSAAVEVRPGEDRYFSDDISIGAYAGYTITYFNLQLAAHLGLNPIYIIGCDHTYKGEGDVKADDKVAAKEENHFIKGYRKPGEIVNAAPIDKMSLAFRQAATFARENGIDIINITRGGALEEFPRESADKVLGLPEEPSFTSKLFSFFRKPEGPAEPVEEVQQPKAPKVSICMPILNGMPYIRECLNSVANQRYDDFEVVIVDGGSTDGTLEVIEAFARGRDNVSVHHLPARGIYDGINQAMRRAKGDYVYILMADDYLARNTIRTLADGLDRAPDCGVAQCGLNVIDEAGTPFPDHLSWEKRPFPRLLGAHIGRAHIRYAPFDLAATLVLGTVYTSLTQIMIRRDYLEKVGEFRSEFGSFGDLEWQMRAAARTNTIYLPDRVAYWRKHAAQASDIGKHMKARANGVFARMVADNRDLIDGALEQYRAQIDFEPLLEWYATDSERAEKLYLDNPGRREADKKLAIDHSILEKSTFSARLGGYENIEMFRGIKEAGFDELMCALVKVMVTEDDLETRDVSVEEAYGRTKAPAGAMKDKVASMFSSTLSKRDAGKLADLVTNPNAKPDDVRNLLMRNGDLFARNIAAYLQWKRARFSLSKDEDASAKNGELNIADELSNAWDNFYSDHKLYKAATDGSPVTAGLKTELEGWDDRARQRWSTVESILKHYDLMPEKGSNWLEYGAGAGHLARAIAKGGFKVTAFDQSGQAMAAALAIGATAPKALQKRLSYTTEWTEVENAGYDGAISLYTFQHMPNVIAQESLVNMCRSLRENGVLVLHYVAHHQGYSLADALSSAHKATAIHQINQVDMYRTLAEQGMELTAQYCGHLINSPDVTDLILLATKKRPHQ